MNNRQFLKQNLLNGLLLPRMKRGKISFRVLKLNFLVSRLPFHDFRKLMNAEVERLNEKVLLRFLKQ
ncbi:hypothetical protein GGD38_006709 [Chitinophagaceae bacterium OAS944]|nr:hypothetical protein [Chitinophagaceae bacterium OAS944]